MQNFILAHEGRVIATRKGSVIADERASGVTTTYAYQLRAFAAAIEAGPAADPVPTSAAQAVATMRVIDDAYRASGLALRP
jgi:predicted dehydrogenase